MNNKPDQLHNELVEHFHKMRDELKAAVGPADESKGVIGRTNRCGNRK